MYVYIEEIELDWIEISIIKSIQVIESKGVIRYYNIRSVYYWETPSDRNTLCEKITWKINATSSSSANGEMRRNAD